MIAVQLDEFTEAFKKQIKEGKVVVFTGAGMSTASGIKDFRGENGIYKENERAEDILHINYFNSNPEGFWDFYRKYLVLNEDVMPNDAHRLIKELQDEGIVTSIITQNIDGLDLKAGCKNIIELHGNTNKFYCTQCHEEYKPEDLSELDKTPRCLKCSGIIRPDIVLYGEGLNWENEMKAQDAINYAKTLLVIGSTLEVRPAADYVKYFYVDAHIRGNKKLFIINKGRTTFDGYPDIYRYDGDVIDFVRKYKDNSKDR